MKCRRKRLILAIAFSCVVIISYNMLLLPKSVIEAEAPAGQRTLSGPSERRSTLHSSRKKILLYTTLFFQMPWKDVPDGYNFTDFDGTPCPVNNCDLTYDKSQLNESDLVVFHGVDLNGPRQVSPNMLRKISKSTARSPNQVWLYFMHESPVYSETDFPSYQGIFNWTATYRTDSDILVTYHYYRELQENDERPKENTNFAEGM